MGRHPHIPCRRGRHPHIPCRRGRHPVVPRRGECLQSPQKNRRGGYHPPLQLTYQKLLSFLRQIFQIPPMSSSIQTSTS